MVRGLGKCKTTREKQKGKKKMLQWCSIALMDGLIHIYGGEETRNAICLTFPCQIIISIQQQSPLMIGA